MYRNWILYVYTTLLYIPFAVHAASLPEDHLIEEPVTEELDSYSLEEKEDDEIYNESSSENPIENRDDAFNSKSEDVDDTEKKAKFERFQESIFVNTLDPNLDNTDIIEISQKKRMELLVKKLSAPSLCADMVKYEDAYQELANLLFVIASDGDKDLCFTPAFQALGEKVALLNQASHREIKGSDYTGELAALYPSLTTISTNLSDMNYFLPPNFFQLVGIVFNMHMLLHYKELSKMKKIGFFNSLSNMSKNILYVFLKSNIKESFLLCYYKFTVSALQFLSNKGLVNINYNFLENISYELSSNEPLRLQDLVQGSILPTTEFLNYKSLMGDKPWYKFFYTPLKNLYLMRNHNFNPKLKSIELGLNMLSYALNLANRTFNKYGIVRSTTVRNALESAQQQKAKIDNYSNELSQVCHALQTGYFVQTCCPPSWQSLIGEDKNYIDLLFKIILDYTYEKGTDYKLIESATDQKFSFFDAPDDDQAETLCIKPRKDNLLAKPTAYVGTSLLTIFAGYSLLSYARKSKN